MIIPFPLYVDEISPDKIKATVSNGGKVLHNMRTMSLAENPFYAHSFRGPAPDRSKEEINGVHIMPIGKYICMVVSKDGGTAMIFLDLIDRPDLAAKMAEKLGHVDLRDKFMQVYGEIISHPKRHGWFQLVLGNEKGGEVGF